MRSIKKTILLICILSMSNAYSIGKNNKIQDAREMIQNGTLHTGETCLDEYLAAQKQLKRMLGVGTLGTGAATSASGAVAAGTIAGAGALSAGAGAAAAGAVLGSAAIAGATVGAVVAVPMVVAYGGYSIAKLVQTNYIIKVLRDSYKGRGSSLNKFTKKYLRRNKEARGYMTREEMREIVLDLDRNGALCDGSMKRKRRIHKLRIPRSRQKLALKKDIYKFIKTTL